MSDVKKRMIYIVISIGCWECSEQTDVIYAGFDREKAHGFLVEEEKRYNSPNAKIEPGPNFQMYAAMTPEEVAAHPCVEHIGRMELHSFESDEVIELTTTSVGSDDRPRPDAFWLPDESGMSGEWSWPGRVFYDPDMRSWQVQVHQFMSRPARPDEIAAQSGEVPATAPDTGASDPSGARTGREDRPGTEVGPPPPNA